MGDLLQIAGMFAVPLVLGAAIDFYIPSFLTQEQKKALDEKEMIFARHVGMGMV